MGNTPEWMIDELNKGMAEQLRQKFTDKPKGKHAEQIERWEKDCRHVDDLVRNCPSLNDTELLLAWYQDFHGWLVYIGNETAVAESLFLQKCAADLKADAIPPNVWTYIKGSSTSLNNYLAGQNSDLFQIWQKLKNLGKTMEVTLADMRTNLVNLREVNSRDRMTAANQGIDERKNQVAKTGARDFNFPTSEHPTK